MRFTVEQAKSGAWWIKDNDHAKYNLPSMAVDIYFKGRQRVDTICNLMNAEWQEFERNPS